MFSRSQTCTGCACSATAVGKSTISALAPHAIALRAGGAYAESRTTSEVEQPSSHGSSAPPLTNDIVCSLGQLPSSPTIITTLGVLWSSAVA